MQKRKKYRYIMSIMDDMREPISRFCLLSGRVVRTDDIRSCTVTRVEIPEDMKLTKHACDMYSIADSDVPVADLNPTPMAYVDGRWRRMPGLAGIPGSEWHQALLDMGIHGTVNKGYLTKPRWQEHVKELQEKAEREFLASLREKN